MRGLPPIEGPVAINILAAMSIPSSWSTKKRDAALAGSIRPTVKPDLDNIEKMLDAFNGIIWVDDVQVVEKNSSKVYAEKPFFRIEITRVLGSML